MSIYNALSNAQPESESRYLGPDGSSPEKLLEDPLLIVIGDPSTVVRDVDVDEASVRSNLYRNLRICRRVFERVIHELLDG